MVRWILVITLTLCATTAYGQDLSDIVNRYTNLRSFTSTGCQATLRVGSTSGFAVGDRILIMQMKGAGADLNDGPSFGRLTTLGNAGRFQFATIGAVNGDELTILEPLLHPFDVSGVVQVIRVAYGNDLRVIAPVRAAPWDGTMGGVVVIEATRSLTLRAPIDADGAGFFGGSKTSGSTICNVTSVVAPDNSAEHARRGTGIVDVPAAQSKGRGFVVNAGGGGNGSNAGGGGGSSAGTGGRGGDQWVGCGRGTTNGGLGGQSVPIDIANVRLFLGGGGGAGHQNNNMATAGASGGGIVIIKAPRLDGQGQSISALGADVNTIAGFDGAGGGGGGGMILIDAATVNNVALQAYGGAGGSIRYTDAHGPGGGGGGGAIFVTTASLPATVSTSIWGGPHGVNVNLTVPADRPYGAQDGSDGLVITSASYDQATPGTALVNTMVRSITVCRDSLVTFTANVSNGTAPYSYEWRDPNNVVIGTGRSVTTQARPPSRIRLRITDAKGCILDDSVTINNGPSPRVIIPDVDLGARPACDVRYNTTVDATITPPTTVRVVSYAVSDPAITVLSPAVGSLFSSTFRLSLRYTGGSSGRAVVSVIVSGPCDTTVTFNVTWTVDTSRASLTPTTFDFGVIDVCDSTQPLSPIEVTYRGRPATLTSLIEENGVRASISLPKQLRDGDLLSVTRLWQGAGAHRGRLGFVISESSCTDTIWIDIADSVLYFQTSVAPSRVDLGTTASCDSLAPLSSFDISYQGSNATLQQLILEGDLETSTAVPQQLVSGYVITFSRTWQGYGTHVGRVGLVISNGSCLDTAWVDVTQSISRPSYFTTNVSMGDIVACRDSIVSMASVLQSNDPTTVFTIVDVTTTSPALSTSLSGGMQIQAGTGFLISLTTPKIGSFRGTISVRVLPCDTLLTIDVDANVVDASITSQPEIAFTSSAVGVTETQRITISNTGTSDVTIDQVVPPSVPFSIAGTERPLPTLLAVGASMWVDVSLTAAAGAWIDSVIVVSSDPCVLQSKTIIRSTVTSATKLWMPRVETNIGMLTNMPVILEERPGFPPEARPEFETTVRMTARDVQFMDLANTATGKAEVVRDGDDVVVTIRDTWNGTDTIATMTLLPLLSGNDSVDIRFDSVSPFRWIDVPSTIEYQHGRLVLSDICGSAQLRTIRFGGAVTSIAITPQPAGDEVTIAVHTTQPEVIGLQMLDVHGRNVHTISGSSEQPSVMDVRVLPSGLYQLVITTRFETRSAPVIIAR